VCVICLDEVLSVAGQGTFGTVLDVFDLQTQSRLALKVVRSVPRYLDAAQVEVDILTAIQRADSHQKSLCVRFIKHFRITHRGHEHECIGFEKLGRSLYDFLKKNQYRGFSLANVARFGYQLLTAIAFCHSIKLVHTDLKLENILLTSSEYRIVHNYSRYRDEQLAREERRRTGRGRSHGEDSDDENSSRDVNKGKVDAEYREPVNTNIRLIDFGGATFEHDHHSRIVNTRQYRAPEVLLGLGWSYPSDLWSCGCILPELFTGELLFGTHEDLEHMALMERILQRSLPDSITRPAVEPYINKRSNASSNWRSGHSKASDSERSEASHSTDRSKRSASHKRDRSSRYMHMQLQICSY
jgi:dual-specificity kinase